MDIHFNLIILFMGKYGKIYIYIYIYIYICIFFLFSLIFTSNFLQRYILLYSLEKDSSFSRNASELLYNLEKYLIPLFTGH